MFVVLDGKRPESALPNMAAAMIVLMVTAHMSGEQPHHVVAQFTVAARPEGEVKMVGHQAIAEQAHARQAFARLAQQLDEGGEIAFFMKYRLAAIAPIE